MTDKDVVQRVSNLFGVPTKTIPVLKDRKPTWKAELNGWAGTEVMRRLLPYMGRRRAEKIRAILRQDKEHWGDQSP